MEGTIQTVLGTIKAADLGRTLTHEHLCLDFEGFYSPPPNHLEEYFAGPITLEKVGFLRQYPYSSKYNLTFNDDETLSSLIIDIHEYLRSGGLTIVENSSHGLSRRADKMKTLSEKTKVNIVAGTGFYVSSTQKESTLKMSVEEMADLIRKELTEGCIEDPSVKCGFIGEVGSSWPIDAFEKKAIQASAAIQEELKCPVSFHPGRNEKAPFEILRIHLEAGGRKDKTVMSHLERTITSEALLADFADLGSFCQFDLFGTECSYYQLNPSIDMPSDAQRLDKIEFGGHGYCHINNNIIPKMRLKGISNDDIESITVKNPAQWLASSF
ncbi:hypothetical protein J437_LFUL001365 [Ladona fulva]|uniref:Phosphotriesterase-related protein n=1 Tax=Ladona fulva TaxID=123851 RepID=A0A8K0JZ16_LADFU|nr:hypothetical protein J437_LFUL001365 [Ladona fulva]